MNDEVLSVHWVGPDPSPLFLSHSAPVPLGSCWGHSPLKTSAFTGLPSWDALSPDSPWFTPSPMTLMKYHLLQEGFPDHSILKGPYQPASQPTPASLRIPHQHPSHLLLSSLIPYQLPSHLPMHPSPLPPTSPPPLSRKRSCLSLPHSTLWEQGHLPHFQTTVAPYPAHNRCSLNTFGTNDSLFFGLIPNKFLNWKFQCDQPVGKAGWTWVPHRWLTCQEEPTELQKEFCLRRWHMESHLYPWLMPPGML